MKAKEQSIRRQIMLGASLLILGLLLSLFVHGENSQAGGGIAAIFAIGGGFLLARAAHLMGRLGRLDRVESEQNTPKP